MPDPNKGPEQGTPPAGNPPQGTPGEKLIAGKYKSVEEAESAIREQDRMITELTDRSKRSEELLAAFATNIPSEPAHQTPKPPELPSSDYSKIVEDPNGVGKKIVDDAVKVAVKEAVSQVQAMYQQAEYGKQVRGKFYSDHKDLVGHEAIVKFYADQVDSESPNMPLQSKFKAIADKTRDYLNRVRGGTPPGTQPPLPVEGAGGAQPPAQPAPQKPTTQEDDKGVFDSVFAERTAELAKKRTPL